MRPRIVAILTSSTTLAATLVMAPPSSADTSFTTPAYPSAACSPVVTGGNLGLVPQQWNASVGLPLTPDGTPAAQRIVIGEFDQTASIDAVNLLLQQCGLDPVTMTTHTNTGGSGALTVGLESTLDVTVVAGALPENASITLVNTASADGWNGMFVNIAEACGLVFDGDPWSGSRNASPGPNFPAGGCIATISWGGAESNAGSVASADWVLDQLAANGVIVLTSAGDEGSGGCISASGTNFGTAVTRSLSSVTVASNVATFTSTTAHGFSAGQQVFIGALYPQYDGMYRILAVPSSTTFTVALVASDQTTAINALASVNFGALEPQYPAVNPNVLAVGGTQWDPQVDSLTYGTGIAYTPGTTTRNYVWWDSSPNDNCANLPDYATSGGQGTGGGQSGTYAMPSYQQAAATASYPSLPARRMMPDLAALAGWPTYAIANPGITIKGAGLTSNVATVYTGTAHNIAVGELVDIALLPSPFTSLNGTNRTVTSVTTTTLSFALTGADIPDDYVSQGNVSQSCTAPCSAAQFPWYQVVGTSAATPLTAVGLAHVNAVLTAKGMSRVTNDGGSMDVHSIVYSSANRSAFTDVVDGSNDIHGLGGYTARSGYDMATGMGVPNFSTLASLLISQQTPTSGGGGGGSSSSPATTSTAEPGSPVVSQPVDLPDPAQPAQPPVVSSPGFGVLVSTGPNTASAPRVTADSRATRTRRAAPRLILPVKRWRVPVLTVPGSPRALAAQMKVGGRWQPLADVTSNRRGRVVLPSIRLTKARTYAVRLIDAGGRTYFVRLTGRR